LGTPIGEIDQINLPNVMSHIHDTLYEITGGRPYVFVIMSYTKEKKAVFDCIVGVLRDQFKLECIRADQVLNSGHDLLAKLQELIKRADLVIAEITEAEKGHSPNVYYEIGYAAGVGRHPLLLIETGKTVPTDLKGMEVIEYLDRFDGIRTFKKTLTAHLRTRLTSNTPLLRDMLEAPIPTPCFIITSPKRAHDGQLIETAPTIRTFGDRLGILGLIRAFGSIFREAGNVELVSPRHSATELLGHDANLYFIGSRKVNEPAGEILKMVQGGHHPRWSFDPEPNWQQGDGTEVDWPAALYRHDKEGIHFMAGTHVKQADSDKHIWTQDYGLVVRAPHPRFKNRIVFLMAGAHSLGTGAACLAASRSSLIKQIRMKLREKTGRDALDKDGIIEDSKNAFWALVKGTVKQPDFLLDEDGVSIEDAGVYRFK
jgi:hypothetical protein